MTLGEFRIELESSRAFATLSGDHNPVHVDPLAARRTLFGRPVAHGIYLLLLALDTWAAVQPGGRCRLASLKVRFHKALGIGDLAVVDEEGAGRLLVRAGGGKVLSVRFATLPSSDEAPVADGCPEAGAPVEADLEGCRERSGRFSLQLDRALASKLFPRLAALLPAAQIAALAATTRVVGMECPGLHSVFAELEADFTAAGPIDAFEWRCVEADPRLQRLQITACGGGMAAGLVAFLRPRPVAQPGFAEIRSRVPPAQFAGQRALVVGGSRGLGEVAAKLLAAGGAEVVLTYHQGVAEAGAVVADIRAGGGRASAISLDVSAATDGLAVLEGFVPTLLLYFATPPIFVAQRGRFGADLFARFAAAYVSDFVTLVEAVDALGGLRQIYYPSSVAVESPEPDMGEYAAAKAAGEAACRFLARTRPHLSLICDRLPRMATDQTSSLIAADAGDAIDHLLTALTPTFASG